MLCCEWTTCQHESPYNGLHYTLHQSITFLSLAMKILDADYEALKIYKKVAKRDIVQVRFIIMHIDLVHIIINISAQWPSG